jgi:hypothetical protein
MLLDHEAETRPLAEDGAFELICGPGAITERLGILDDLGFDDVILSPWDSERTKGRQLTAELLAELRALYPVDEANIFTQAPVLPNTVLPNTVLPNTVLPNTVAPTL